MRDYVAGTVLVAGALLAFWMSAQSALERRNLANGHATLHQLRDLSRLEVETRELVLATRNGYLDTFDRLVVTDRAMRQKMAEILESHGDLPELVRASGEFELYRSEVERYKRSRSRLRNSLRYLPELAQQGFSEGAKLERPAAAALANAAMLLSQPFPATEATRRALDAIRDEYDMHPAVGEFLLHAEVVAKSGQDTDSQISALRGHAFLASLEQLTEALATQEEARSERLATISFGASILSSCLICAMGLSLFALRRSATSLRETNDGLAEEVRIRSSELAQAQKLESIGQLAAGIAHEINTPAQFVSDNLEFIDDSLADLVPLLDSVEAVLASSQEQPNHKLESLREAAAQADLDFLAKELPGAVGQSREGISRVAEIVKAMKDFSHPGAEGFQRVDLNRSIESTVTVARNEWKYVAEVEFALEGSLPPIPCHAGEINQCVLNILVNAAHAIEAKRGSEPPLGTIRISTRLDGDFARVEIQDNGGGIPVEAQPRVFDPFFTTKGVGKGTGQGLSIAYASIVEKHNGTLGFDVEEGVGTTFVIRLPIARPGDARDTRERT